MPEQSLKEVEPSAKLYLIPGHLKHSPPTSENVPGKHGWHDPAPSSELVPGEHRVHAVDPFFENVPREHVMHAALELARCCGP
jgi:hypothetical protein